MKKSIFLFLTILTVNIQNLCAQDETARNFRLWTDFFLHYTHNKHFRYLFQTNYKYQVNNSQYQQVSLKPTIIYAMNKVIYLQGGIQLQYSDEESLHELEFRTWEGVNIFFPRLASFSINNFFRIEERFFFNNQDEKAEFRLRGRYAISGNIPLNKNELVAGVMYIKPYFELYADLGGDIDERLIYENRYSFGIGYCLHDNIRIEASYLLDRERDTVSEPYRGTTRSARLSFRYLLDHKKGEPLVL